MLWGLLWRLCVANRLLVERWAERDRQAKASQKNCGDSVPPMIWFPGRELLKTSDLDIADRLYSLAI